MLQSVFVYGFMIFTMMFFGSIAQKKEKNLRSRNRSNTSFFNIETFLILLIFSIFSGMRYDVGVDFSAYLDSYLSISQSSESHLYYEPLFYFFTRFFSEAGFHYSIYFGIIAFIQLFFVLYAFKEERYLYPFLIFVLMTNGTFFTFMNGIRQSIVLCVFIYMVKFAQQKKIIPFLIGVFVTYFIHKSSLFLIPLFVLLIIKKEYFKSIWLQYALIIGAALLSSSSVWDNFIDILGKATVLFGYEENYGNLDRVMEIFEQDYTKGIRFYAPLLIYLTVTLFYNKLKENYKGTSFLTYYNLYFIGAICYFLFYNNVLLRRPAMYLIYIHIIITAYLLHYLWSNIQKNKLYFPVFFTVIVLHLLILYAYIAANFHTYYHFFWD